MARILNNLGRIVAICIAVAGLSASEHHGTVVSAGFPLPGVTVTVTMGDRKLVTTTDENGVYSFADLPDGVWTVQVEMLGFGKFTREVGIAPDAPSPRWDLKLLSVEQMRAAIAAAASSTTPAAPQAAATPATSTTASTTPSPAKPAANGKPAAPAAATASASTPARSNNAAGGRGGQNANANGRPSLRQAVGQNSFQRANVNASTAEGENANAEPAADLGAAGDIGSSDAFVVGGSVSAGLGMQQTNDWGIGGRGGFGMDGMGGPGGMMGMGGPGQGFGGDGAGPNQGGDLAAGGRGGRGAGGPGGPGGPGGRGGGFGAPGFAGGGRAGGGRGGTGGGRAGGRGAPAGRGNVNAFGNGRRNARQRYNANINFSLNNSALDARQYSLTGQSTPKAAFAQAGLSGSIGGPLKIPHLLSGQKTTFTLNYQMRRNRNANNVTTTVPTEAERGGDFSNAVSLTGKPVTIFDPTTGQPFNGNVIPKNQLSTQAIGLMNFYPLPNFTSSSSTYNYQVPLVSRTNSDNVNARINGTINPKNQMSGNISFQRSDGTNPNLFGFTSNSHQDAYNIGVNYVYHITNRLIQTLGYNFSRNAQNSTPYFANRQDVTGQLGITYPFGPLDPNYWGPPSLSFSNGFAGLSDGSTTRNHSQTSAITDSILWVHAAHQIRFGGDFRRQQFNNLNQANARGTLTFTGALSGFDMADFMLGLPYTSSIANGNADKYFRASWLDSYITDDWRLSTRLSLSLGLRWDYQIPTTELYGRLVNVNVGPNFATAQPVCAGPAPGGACATASQVGLPNSLFHTSPHEFQPRVGYAWRPFAKASTVVRGGFGIYYNTSVYQSLAPQMAQQAPFSSSWIDTSVTTPLTLVNGFPRPSLNLLPTFGVDPNLSLGYAEVWQLSVQQSLPAALVATVTYNGTKGTHQTQQFIPNSVPPGFAASPYPSNYTYMSSNGNSISNTVSGQMQRRFRSGFSGNVVYTYARALDNAGSLGGRGGGGGASAAQNWQDLASERARTSGVRTHTLNNQLQYSTGVGTRGGTLINGWKGQLLKDWSFTTTITVASGAPETPIVSSKALGGTGIIGPLRANYMGGPIYNSDGTLNPAAFAVPTLGYGNAGRNIITGPMLFNLNAGASRIFRLGERRSMDLQVQSTNTLNHVTFGSFNTTVGSLQYGLLQSPSQMRNIVANLRFRF